jgi:hypothetical protein
MPSVKELPPLPWLAVVIAGFGLPTTAQHFSDVTAEAGIDHHQFASLGPSQLEPYYMSGGAAAGDYDQDGRIDLFVTRMDAPGILYRNLGGRFVAIPGDRVGIELPSGGNGAAWGDIDNDGDLDLYVTTVGRTRNFLYLNQGDGTFREAAGERGAAVENQAPAVGLRAYGFGAAFGDFDLDGFLDLHTTSWLDFGTGPRGHPGGVGTRLLRNRGTAGPGFFEDVTERAGVAMNRISNRNRLPDVSFAFAPRFSDLDDDGYPDLAIAADFGTSRLFWNNGDGTFTDGTAAAAVGTEENGMGSAIGDFDGDGRLDWFVTSVFHHGPLPLDSNWGGSGNRLYRNLGQRGFQDTTDHAGVRDGGWGWGASFLDYDLDGDLDLIMTNGIDFPQTPEDRQFNHDSMRLWRNQGDGTFLEVAGAEGVLDTGSGKGLVVLDFDDDGDPDVFVVNNRGQPVLYQNHQAGTNRWLKIQLEGVRSNRQGIGARLTLIADLESPQNTTQVREIDGGSNFLGQNAPVAMFGLGGSREVVDRVIVRWPSGWHQKVDRVPANTTLRVQEASDYAMWQARFFTATERLDASVSGEQADPDGDGLANLAEYAFGRDPLSVESAPVWDLTLAESALTHEPTLVLALSPESGAVEAGLRVETAPALSAEWLPIGSIDLGTTSLSAGKPWNLLLPMTADATFFRIGVVRVRGSGHLAPSR